MTKHLRLLWVTLLMCVCTVGGWAETKSVVCTLAKEASEASCTGDATLTLSYGRGADNSNKNGVYWYCSNGEVSVTAKLSVTNVTITKVVLNAKCGKTTPKVGVEIGGAAFGKTPQSLTTTNKDYTFEGTASGDIVINFTGKASSSPGSYFLKTITVYYDDASSGTTKNKPTVSFTGLTGEGVTLTEGKLADNSDFTGYTATATYASNTVAGDFAYTASGDGVATVDETTGAVTVNPTVYGTTTVTATFTPTDGENYDTATASYTIKNNQKVDEVDESAIVFDCSGYSTDIVGSSYDSNNNKDRELSSVAGKKYTFKLNKCMFNSSSIQMRNSNGLIKSPTFDAFENGYKLVVTYDQNIPAVSSDELTDAKAVTDATKKTVTIELPSPTATFTIKASNGYVQVKKMELTALTPANPKPEISFAETSQTVELKDKLATVQTLTKPADLSDEVITYSSSDNDIAEVDGKDILLCKVGTVTITATSAATDTYSAATATYTLNVVDTRPTDADFKFAETQYEINLNETNGEFNAGEKLLNPHNLAVTYTISDEENAEIKTDGTVTVLVKGTYTITATGKSDDYKETTATCTLVVTTSVEEKVVEFEAGTHKGTATTSKADKMAKDCVTISSTDAALARADHYKFYGQGVTTISTRMGTIKTIEFISNSSTGKYTTVGFDLESGEPGELKATTTSAVWSGSAKEVKIKNKSGAQIQVSSIKVTVEIPVAKSYALDDASESNTLEDYDNANVTINRTIGTDGWYTLCLPFALTESETKKYFGDDVNIRTFDSMEGTVMNFKKVTEMEAGKPYLVKTSTGFDGTTTPFKGVQLKAADPDQTSKQNGYKMQGIYNKTTLATDGSQLFLGDNNKFFKPSTDGNTMKGFRVYFEVPMENGVPMNLSAANIDGVETALTRIDGETVNNDTRVFNLQGQYLGTSLSNLPSGIYVQGGKKVVVK